MPSKDVEKVAQRPLAVHTARTLTEDIKIRKVVSLTLANFTPNEIAKMVRMPAHKVHQVIEAFLAQRVESSDIESLKVLHLERLAELRASRWDRALDGQDDKALDAVTKIMDREATVLGLNAPATTRITGADGGAVEVSVVNEAKKIIAKTNLEDIIDAEIISDDDAS